MCISPSSSSPTAASRYFRFPAKGERERPPKSPLPRKNTEWLLPSSSPLSPSSSSLIVKAVGRGEGGRGERRRKTMTPLGGEGGGGGGGLCRVRGGKMLLPVARHLYCRIRILENIAIFFLENYASKICERVRAPKVRRGGKEERGGKAEGGEVGFFLSSPLSLSILLLSDLAKPGELVGWWVGRSLRRRRRRRGWRLDRKQRLRRIWSLLFSLDLFLFSFFHERRRRQFHLICLLLLPLPLAEDG